MFLLHKKCLQISDFKSSVLITREKWSKSVLTRDRCMLIVIEIKLTISLLDCNILINIHPSVITVWQGSSRTKKNKKWIRHKFFNFWNYFLVAGRAALSNVRSLLNVSRRWSARRARTQFPCCWPPDRVLRIINHIPQFTPSSWGRPGDIMSACDWLPAVFVCEKEKKKRERKIKEVW